MGSCQYKVLLLLVFGMERGGSGVLETVCHSERPALLAYELWTVISVADCWNPISCKVSFCLVDNRGG